jgi:transcriptional regulator with XRE-family HTH domain
MQAQLKENILRIAESKGWSISKLEKYAGLSKNFINNFLTDKSKNPGIESIVKIANACNTSVDELLGKEPIQKLYDLEITRKDIFTEVTNFLISSITSKQKTKVKLDQYFYAVYQIYAYSLNKKTFDKEFASWFINTQLF